MKKLLFVVVLLLPCLLFGQNRFVNLFAEANKNFNELYLNSHDDEPSVKMLDLKYGFRDLKFKTPLKELRSMTKSDDGYYRYSLDSMNVGGFDVKDIYYDFDEHGLSSINVIILGDDNGNGILSVLQDCYGRPDMHKSNVDDRVVFVWTGKLVTLIFLSLNDDSEISAFRISCNKDVVEVKYKYVDCKSNRIKF